MGRVPPHEYTNAPRGGFNQLFEKLPQGSRKPDTIAISNSDPHDNIELAVDPDRQRFEMEYRMAARNAKSYFVFASFFELLGLIFSIISMASCNFASVKWAVDGSTAAYQADISQLGLFRWYNYKTSSCWAYNPRDIDFFYVDKIAQGLAAAAVTLGGIAMTIVAVIFVVNLLGRSDGGGCCSSRFNLNSTSNSNTFFTLSGLTFVASILQICTLTYFNQGSVPNYAITCNANLDSNCTMAVGAHYAIIAFVMYLMACFVYAMAGVGCRVVEGAYKEKKTTSGRGGTAARATAVTAAAAAAAAEEDDDDDLPPPPPPPPPLPPQAFPRAFPPQEEDLGSDDDSGPPPPAPFTPYSEDESMQSV